MAKHIFRANELKVSDKVVILEAPQNFMAQQAQELLQTDEADVEETYEGPTADDLRREAEIFKKNWGKEKEAMIAAARAEAETIIKNAEATAFQEVKRKSDQAQIERQKAEDEAAEIIQKAQEEAALIEKDARAAFQSEADAAQKEGFTTGHEEGYASGKGEVERLIERLHTVLERAQQKREEILAETEQQLVDLVLLISRKVIKVLSENQRTVVVSNVVQALRKVKGRGDITIRVNIADLKLTSEHTKDFLKLIEGAKNISVMEDSSVDRGGCIIETDFGEIDARISSQMSELEQKILEMSPIKTKPRTIPVDER